MFSPLLSVLIWFLPSGGGAITSLCEQSSVSPISRTMLPGDSWVVSCLDSWSTGNTYHYVPRSSATVAPSCNTSGSYSISADVFNNSYSWLRTQTTIVPINWVCVDRSAEVFDSTLNHAASNVGKSPTFWSLFALALSAGVFLGSITYGISKVNDLIEGGEKDA